jgi:5-oxoprolinase (ATP-hydrolysing) subunit A
MRTGVKGKIDLNADVGEGIPGDERLLDVVTSANIACGFHAGDQATMRALCRVAAARGVAVGAHVGYRDREGFGRRPLAVSPAVVESETVEQIAALQAAGGPVRYVKPHGALYTRAAKDRTCADAIAAAARASAVAAVLGPPGSQLLEAAAVAGLTAVPEGFADRGYLPDGALVPRDRPDALRGEDDAVSQALLIVREGAVVAVGGRRIAVAADSICIHGDSPGAETLARRIAQALRDAGIELATFA